jgi:NO-binding membrane sensor protein with MHYT domain
MAFVNQVKEMRHTTMKAVVNRKAVARTIKYTALFGRLWRILGGGLCAALGVLGMHYLGMSAQRTNATMQLDVGVVMLSCVIAFATANAAFWILFRAVRTKST